MVLNIPKQVTTTAFQTQGSSSSLKTEVQKSFGKKAGSWAVLEIHENSCLQTAF